MANGGWWVGGVGGGVSVSGGRIGGCSHARQRRVVASAGAFARERTDCSRRSPKGSTRRLLGKALNTSDSCSATQSHAGALAQYKLMQDGIAATGRPMVFSLCGWLSWYAAAASAAGIGTSWRIGPDALCKSMWRGTSAQVGWGGWGGGVGGYR